MSAAFVSWNKDHLHVHRGSAGRIRSQWRSGRVGSVWVPWYVDGNGSTEVVPEVLTDDDLMLAMMAPPPGDTDRLSRTLLRYVSREFARRNSNPQAG